MHCNRGVSRSATFVVAHLMKARALDPASALELVRAARPQAEPNAAFLKQLDVLHAELEASRKRDAARLGTAPARPVAKAPEPPARATAGPAPCPVAGPARPERRAGPAPRPVATAPARPERAIGAPARPERAGPVPRPLPTAPPRPEKRPAIGPAPPPKQPK